MKRGADAVNEREQGNRESRPGVAVAEAAVDARGKLQGFQEEFVQEFKVQGIGRWRGFGIVGGHHHRHRPGAHQAELFEQDAGGLQIVGAILAVAQAALDPCQAILGLVEPGGKGRGVESGRGRLGQRIIGVENP